MTGFKSFYMCIVAKRCENVTFWDISQKWMIKPSTFYVWKKSLEKVVPWCRDIVVKVALTK